MRLDPLFRDTLTYLGARVAAGAAGLAWIWILARELGPEAYGVVGLAVVVATWTAQLTGGWIRQAVLRYRKELELRGRGPVAAATAVRLTTVAAVVAALAAATWVFVDGSAPVLATAAYAAGLTVWGHRGAVAQADLRPRAVAISDLIRTAVPVVVLVGAGVAGVQNADAGLWALAIAVGLAAWLLPVPRVEAPGRIDRDLALRFAAYGVPMGIWLALSTGHALVGRLVLEAHGAAETLGAFSAAQDLTTRVAALLLMPVTLAVHSRAMTAWAAGRIDEMNRDLGRARTYVLAVGTAIVIAAHALAEPTSAWLFGATTDGISALSWSLLTVAAVASQIGLVVHKPLELGERTWAMCRLMALSLALDAVVVIGLVDVLGPDAPALGGALGAIAYALLASRAGGR